MVHESSCALPLQTNTSSVSDETWLRLQIIVMRLGVYSILSCEQHGSLSSLQEMAQRPKHVLPQKAKKPQLQQQKKPADHSGSGTAASTDEDIVLDNPGSEMSIAVTRITSMSYYYFRHQ